MNVRTYGSTSTVNNFLFGCSFSSTLRFYSIFLCSSDHCSQKLKIRLSIFFPFFFVVFGLRCSVHTHKQMHSNSITSPLTSNWLPNINFSSSFLVSTQQLNILESTLGLKNGIFFHWQAADSTQPNAIYFYVFLFVASLSLHKLFSEW